MYTVVICEDESVFRKTHERICCEIFEKLNIEYHISLFESSAEFRTAFLKGTRYDLILLDIVMDDTNGVELARMIREHDVDAAIIFITSNVDFALQGYDVNALHYLMKPVDAAVLERLITLDYQRRFQNHFLVFKSGAQSLRIPVRDVVCLETVGRRVELTLVNGTCYYSGKLTDLLSELPRERFVRCHQAFALNIVNIRELKRQSAIAVNGKEIPVSRTFMKNVQQAFLRQMQEG